MEEDGPPRECARGRGHHVSVWEEGGEGCLPRCGTLRERGGRGGGVVSTVPHLRGSEVVEEGCQQSISPPGLKELVK